MGKHNHTPKTRRKDPTMNLRRKTGQRMTAEEVLDRIMKRLEQKAKQYGDETVCERLL
jgi:gamma-glutamyl:cysteine ligase YbdK (ATP-grasp superfamily)